MGWQTVLLEFDKLPVIYILTVMIGINKKLSDLHAQTVLSKVNFLFIPWLFILLESFFGLKNFCFVDVSVAKVVILSKSFQVLRILNSVGCSCFSHANNIHTMFCQLNVMSERVGQHLNHVFLKKKIALFHLQIQFDM